MTPIPTQLPRPDRHLLNLIQHLVPRAQREDFARTWHAELWHLHHRTRSTHTLTVLSQLALGITRDALWLRTESWRQRYAGTATLCLNQLLTLTLLSAAIAFLLTGSAHALILYLAVLVNVSVVAAILVVFVSFATCSTRHTQQPNLHHRLKRLLFFTTKIALSLLLTSFLSADLCQPLSALFPISTHIFQILCFVILALVALRWAFTDQDQRCKHCLHLLATPARVGRPSYNLLEWNGSEMTCKHGHGLLSVPEMETSWCESSQWIDWDEAAFS